MRLGGERFFHPQGLAALVEHSGAFQVAAFFGVYDLATCPTRRRSNSSRCCATRAGDLPGSLAYCKPSSLPAAEPIRLSPRCRRTVRQSGTKAGLATLLGRRRYPQPAQVGGSLLAKPFPS